MHSYKIFFSAFSNKLRELRSKSKFKVLLSIGSFWTHPSQVFAVLGSEASRRRFITYVINLVRTQDYDGMEIFIKLRPNVPEERQRFTLFIQVNSLFYVDL